MAYPQNTVGEIECSHLGKWRKTFEESNPNAPKMALPVTRGTVST